ncbi:MAG: 1-acyl-sn-glycerol-3-phosphate acyltransferase, partial [Thermoguttaceae bacterium]
GRDLADLFSYRYLFWIAIASAFFWGLAALSGTNIDKFATQFLCVKQEYVGLLAATLSIGIGVGAVLCGLLSRGRIELGLVPIGAFGIGVFLIFLGFNPSPNGNGIQESVFTVSFIYAAVMLFIMGACAGLYDIPLAAYIQQKSPIEKRGRLLAAYNFFSFSGMLLFTGLFLGSATLFGKLNEAKIFMYPASLSIWLLVGVMVLVVCGILVYAFYAQVWNCALTFVLWVLYRPKVYGKENIPTEGGALFVSNHVSLLDGFLLYTNVEKGIRFFAHSAYIPKGPFELLAKRTRIIRVLPGKKVVQAIKEAREGLKNGDFVGIFPEGGITRTGQIRAFEPGFLSILKGDENVPIIPVFIGGMYGSMFSYKYGEKIIPIPRKLRKNVVVAFGKPIHSPTTPQEVQRAVEELGVDVMRKYGKKLPVPPRQMVRSLRKCGSRELMRDTTGAKLSGSKFLLATLVLRRILRREVLAKDEKNIGLFVPMSVGGCLTNATLALDNRVAVNLNFTFTEQILNGCIEKADIKHVLTSR